MKLKRIALFGIASAALTSAASAQVTIRITGSTAFRGATHEAIRKILKPGFLYGYTGSSFTGASQAIFSGTTIATAQSPETAVVIKTAWAGSVGGIKTLAQNVNVANWLKNPDGDIALPNNVQWTTGGFSGINGAVDPDSTNVEPALPNIAMSDTFQNSTEFRSPSLTDRVVGVVAFQWMRNAGAPVALNNMTPLLAASLLSGGLPLSQFTGIPADGGTAVWGIGRDEDSGTRLTAFAESGYGVFSSPLQYQTQGSPITNIRLYPENQILGTTYPPGHSGYGSGSLLVAAMNAPGSISSPGNPGWLVGYASTGDAASVNPGTVATATATVSGGAVTALNLVAPGLGGTLLGASTTVTFSGGGPSVTTSAAATPIIANGIITGFTITNPGAGYTEAPTVAIRSGAALAWNGVSYSPQAVREGQYTFWGYEHLMYRPGYAQAAVANQLADQIKNNDAPTSGISLSTMHCGRQVEGGPVTPDNPYP